MFILAKFATERSGRLRDMTARTQFYYVDPLTSTFGRRQYLPDVMDYLPVRSITVCGKKLNKKLSHQCGPPLIGQTMTRRHRLSYVQWVRRHFIWQCVDWNSVSFSGETRFALSNVGGKIHKTSVAGIATCWKGIDLVGTVSWFGVEKWVTRRRTLLSCKTISMHYIDDIL